METTSSECKKFSRASGALREEKRNSALRLQANSVGGRKARNETKTDYSFFIT